MFRYAILEHLESAASPREAPATEIARNRTLEWQAISSDSSAEAEPGIAEMPLRSGSVSRQEIGEPILRAIMAAIKSTKSTLPELVEFSEDSSTLVLTLRWPMTSGSIRDGALGEDREDVTDYYVCTTVGRFTEAQVHQSSPEVVELWTRLIIQKTAAQIKEHYPDADTRPGWLTDLYWEYEAWIEDQRLASSTEPETPRATA